MSELVGISDKGVDGLRVRRGEWIADEFAIIWEWGRHGREGGNGSGGGGTR